MGSSIITYKTNIQYIQDIYNYSMDGSIVLNETEVFI